MSSAIREWLNLTVRWFHVFAGIMWLGQTYYFTWLDGQFGRHEKKVAASETTSAVWMGHSGGFYSVEKQKLPGGAPEQIHRSEEHTSELQSPCNPVCRLLLEKKKKIAHAVYEYAHAEGADVVRHGGGV